MALYGSPDELKQEYIQGYKLVLIYYWKHKLIETRIHHYLANIELQETIKLVDGISDRERNRYQSTYFVTVKNFSLGEYFEILQDLVKRELVNSFDLSRRTLTELFQEIAMKQIKQPNFDSINFEIPDIDLV